MDAQVNGTRLYYETVGDGPLCLVMHGGLGLDHTLYRDFDRLGGRLRLVYYDHRGNGRSGRPDLSTLTMSQLADDAAALVDRLGGERVFVLGHSYGGFVAQEFALRHPGRVAGLVLIDTTPGGPGRAERPADLVGPPMPAELARAMGSTPPSDAAFVAGFRPLMRYYLHHLDPTDVAPRLDRVIFSAAAMTRSMQVLASWSSVDRLPLITAPTLVLVGRHDVVTAPVHARRIARAIAGSQCVEFAESGHFPWWEEPDAFFGLLDGWLDRHLARSGKVSA
ncbi:MAG TPA: alpha/beta hydrolase [Jatrophihabitans sp.]|nr:alpha/beta hydrolase [Jatrophihabitans sp.]